MPCIYHHHSLFRLRACLAALALILGGNAHADDGVEADVSLITNASSGIFAPYFISALDHGVITQGNSALVDFSVSKPVDTHARLSYGFGAEVIAGASSRVNYQQWHQQTHSWQQNRQGPSAIWLQQMYAEAKYRSINLMAGLKEFDSHMLNQRLSSGDLVESGNARPIPQIRAGFYDFVDVPLTSGWLQVNGAVAYGFMPDDRYNRNHYSYYSYHLAENVLYNYKYCYFRTREASPLSVTFGMQLGAMFGGKAIYYTKGEFLKEKHYSSDLKTLIGMTLPVLGTSENFVDGSTVGSIDICARYRLHKGHMIRAYMQCPFEDGSGMAKLNKFDGLWGLEYKTGANGLVSAIVVEYIDMRDQSGPIHYAPGDLNNPTLTSSATGCDNYYNNAYYNSYVNYGMAIGTPFLLAPIYNLDGYPAFVSTRVNGMHLGIMGTIAGLIPYRMLFGHQRGLGTYNVPFAKTLTDTSFMLECSHRLSDRINILAKVAVDRGKLRGNNIGAMLSLTYSIKTK